MVQPGWNISQNGNLPPKIGVNIRRYLKPLPRIELFTHGLVVHWTCTTGISRSSRWEFWMLGLVAYFHVHTSLLSHKVSIKYIVVIAKQYAEYAFNEIKTFNKWKLKSKFNLYRNMYSNFFNMVLSLPRTLFGKTCLILPKVYMNIYIYIWHISIDYLCIILTYVYRGWAAGPRFRV